jgi:hypothetical protein
MGSEIMNEAKVYPPPQKLIYSNRQGVSFAQRFLAIS